MHRINVRQGKRYAFRTHTNEMLLPREESEALEAFLVIVEPGYCTHSHVHSDTEQLYYVISGKGRAVFRYPDGRREEVAMVPEDVIYVPRDTEHQIFCEDATAPLRYLCVDGFPLGKPSDEPTWDDHYRAVMAAQG